MNNIHKIYEDATKAPLTPEEQAKIDAQEQELKQQAQAVEGLRKSFLNQPFTNILIAEIEKKELQLRSEAAQLALSGNPNNELIRAKIVESVAIARVVGFMYGHLKSL